jgi:hypothetical protein
VLYLHVPPEHVSPGRRVVALSALFVPDPLVNVRYVPREVVLAAAIKVAAVAPVAADTIERRLGVHGLGVAQKEVLSQKDGLADLVMKRQI